MFEPQLLATGVTYKEPCTAKEITQFFISKNVRTSRLKLIKNKSKLKKFWEWEVQTQKVTITIIYIYLLKTQAFINYISFHEISCTIASS